MLGILASRIKNLQQPGSPMFSRWLARQAVVAFFGWTVAIIAGVLPEFPTKAGAHGWQGEPVNRWAFRGLLWVNHSTSFTIINIAAY